MEILEKSDPELSDLFVRICNKNHPNHISAKVFRNGVFEKTNYGTLKEVIITNNVGRNDPCPCGSGKKYKKCCE